MSDIILCDATVMFLIFLTADLAGNELKFREAVWKWTAEKVSHGVLNVYLISTVIASFPGTSRARRRR